MSPRALAALFAPVALATLAAAQEPDQPKSLLPGDPAPALRVAEWIQGQPVESFQKGKPYVVEFWATWCGPCKRSIPHINELYLEHKEKGLQVVGVSIWERDTSGIVPFVEKMGDTMSYSVARDEVPEGDERGQKGFMAMNWMQAAGQNGIPSAFIIDGEGRVAWIGHPMSMDEPLKAVMAGTWDVAAARTEFKRQREIEAKTEEVNAKIGEALGRQDYTAAIALLDEIIALDPELAVNYAPTRFDWMLRGKDLDAAYAWGREMVGGKLAENSMMLNAIAWMIVDPERTDLARRDLDLAQKAAEQADKLTKSADPNVIDTLARVHFMRGNTEKAIELQQKAVELATDERQKASLQGTLDEYRKGGIQ